MSVDFDALNVAFQSFAQQDNADVSAATVQAPVALG